MSVPSLAAYQNGINVISGDNLNTFVQTCNNSSTLRAFTGTANMTVNLLGISAPNDGSGGAFWWNSASTAPDDNYNVIVPPGAASGAWNRVQQGSTVYPVSVNVKSFGALGDGVTDDTVAIQAALTAGAGKAVFFPTPNVAYLVSTPLLVASNTLVYGDGPGSLLTASAAWNAQSITSNYMFFKNVNWAASSLTDSGITIELLGFTYVNLQTVPSGGNHAIRFTKANNITVRDCYFNYGNDAVAFLGCNDTLIEGCYAFNNNNCPYDHWDGPTNARVIGCYAETGTAVQMVNFNATMTGSDSLTADGCVVDGCIFIFTGSGNNTPTLNFYTLAPNCHVKNVVISNNKLSNVMIRGVGDCENVVIANNVCVGQTSNTAAIAVLGDGTGTPANTTVSGNIIVNPNTAPGDLAVIRIWSTGYVIANNTISGNTYTANNIDTSTFVGVLVGNNFAQGAPAAGINATKSDSGTSNVVTPNGYFLAGLDNVGGLIGWAFQTDNNIIFKSTDASGGAINLMSFSAHTSAPNIAVTYSMSFGSITVGSGSPFQVNATGDVKMAKAGFNGNAALTKPTVTGSRGANAALTSLLTALAAYGLVTDTTT